MNSIGANSAEEPTMCGAQLHIPDCAPSFQAGFRSKDLARFSAKGPTTTGGGTTIRNTFLCCLYELTTVGNRHDGEASVNVASFQLAPSKLGLASHRLQI